MSDKPWYETVLDVVKGVAPTVANFVVPGSGLLVDKLMREVTGDETSPIEEVAARIGQSPELQMRLAEIAKEKEIRLAEIANDRARIAVDAQKVDADLSVGMETATGAQMETVNQTMRVEASQAGWAGKWRPFWGFVSACAFGLSIAGIIGWVGYALVTKQLDLLKVLPELILAMTTLFSVPGAILGVASWHRGMEKRTLAQKMVEG